MSDRDIVALVLAVVFLTISFLNTGCTPMLSTVDANGNEAYASCPKPLVKMPTMAKPTKIICIPKP